MLQRGKRVVKKIRGVNLSATGFEPETVYYSTSVHIFQQVEENSTFLVPAEDVTAAAHQSLGG